MKIKINKDALNRALQFLQPGIPSKVIIPASGWIKFSVDNDKCVVAVCTPSVEMTAFVKAESEGSCEFCVPAHIISRMVATFPDGDINIDTIEDENLGVKTLKLKPSGQRKSYQIGCTPAVEFSMWNYNFDDLKTSFKINFKELIEKIRIVGPNIPTSDVRGAFSNLTLFSNHKKKLSFVTGDQHIICRIDTDDIDFETSMVVDNGIVKYLSALNESGDCEVKITNSKFYLSCAGFTVCCPMVDVSVPNYQEIFNTEPPKFVEISREELIESLVRVSVFNGDDNRVNLQVKEGQLRLFARNQSNKAEEILDTTNVDNLEMNVDMNHLFFRKALSGLKCDTIKMAVSNGGQSFFVKPLTENKDNQLWMFAPLAKLQS